MNSDHTASPLPRHSVYMTIGTVALVLRLLLFFVGPWVDVERAYRADTKDYLVLANNLRLAHTYGKRDEESPVRRSIQRLQAENGTLPPRDAQGYRADAFRAPGYPALLAVMLSICSDLRAVLLLQCLAGTFSAMALVRLAADVGLSNRAASLAGLLYALHPVLVLADVTLLSESCGNAATIAAFVLVARRSAVAPYLGGLMLGIATLIRPGQLLVWPALAYLDWHQHRSYRSVLGMTAAFLLLPGLWTVRNAADGNGLRLTTLPDLHVLYYDASYTVSESRGIDWLDNWNPMVDELTQRLAERLQPGEDVVSAARRLGFEIIAEHPLDFARVLVKAQLKVWLGHSYPEMNHTWGGDFKPTGLFSQLVLGEPRQTGQAIDWYELLPPLLWLVFNLVVAVMALVGLLRALHRRELLLLVVAALTCALYLLAVRVLGGERMRLPMLPFMLLLAGRCLGSPPQISHQNQT